jgi:hypothetical protein
MEKDYHQIIPCLVMDQMPDAFRDFFVAQKHTDELLKADAVRPDEVYHDNLAVGADIHHAHSYKLQPQKDGSLKWLDGDCIERVKAIAIDVRNWRASGGGDYKLVCRGLGEMSHYAIDCHTYPHLFHGAPWSTHHVPWEVRQARWLRNHWRQIGPLKFALYKDLYKAFAGEAREMYPEAVRVVDNLEEGRQLTDGENLDLARKIATAVGSCWLTVTAKFWPAD